MGKLKTALDFENDKMGRWNGKLKVKEAAELLECSSETVRRLNRNGILKAHRDFLGHRVFELDELLKLKAQREELH